MEETKRSQETNSQDISTTFYSEAILRPEKHLPITETDLENYVAESAWKAFDKSRAEIAKRLATSELNLTLREVIVVGMKIDGHRVLNPVGFSGKEIEITVLITVSKKSFMGAVVPNSYEGAVLSSYTLTEESDNGTSAIYVEFSGDKTNIFAKTPKKTSYIGSLEWGEKDLLKTIGDMFLADQDVSREILQRFLTNEVSDIVAEKISKVFYQEFKAFILSLSELALKTTGLKKSELSGIFMNASFLPQDVYGRTFLFNSKRVRIKGISETAKAQDFLKDKVKLYGNLNEAVMRRMKWVTTS